jgi:hypothetical protein
MAFNGSGTYNLPAGNPVTTGSTISSTWANSTLSDIASALTNCITRDGQSPPTANIPHGGYKLTGLGQASATGDALGWGQNGNLATLVLGADPSTNMQAATKQYVDNNSGGFPSGTAMLFVQTSAPTGWTKSTTHNDKALRVVSGTASSGGTYTFSSTFTNGNTGAFTLSSSEMPSHNHNPLGQGPSANANLASLGASGSVRGIMGGSDNNGVGYYASNAGGTAFISSTGGGGSHSHSLSLAVAYVDVIICTKN